MAGPVFLLDYEFPRRPLSKDVRKASFKAESADAVHAMRTQFAAPRGSRHPQTEAH